MFIVYKNINEFRHGPETSFIDLPKPEFGEEWFLGIDGSSTSYGLTLYNYDYSKIHMFIFCRDNTETAESFREVMYDWLRNYLFGVSMETVTYEKTPEGYKPPSTHAQKVMQETESAVRNFVYDRNYLLTRGKDYIFDIYPNSWKSFSVPKSKDNVGKVDKELNARAVLESCGLDADRWLSGFDRLPYKHDYDCFEALGVGRYGSHFLLQDDDTVKVYKNFSKIGTHIIVAKRIDAEYDIADELEFVGSFGKGKVPRMCSLNENHSIPENLLGLYDKEFNNILIVPGNSELGIYLDLAFGFNLADTRDYIIMGTRSSKTDIGTHIVKKNGYVPIYI